MPGANTEPFDLLAIGAHPDDVELFAGATLARAARAGRRIAIIDLTRGETASRGTAEQRAHEAAAAAEILGIAHRENLDLGDARLADSDLNRSILATAIRRLRPRAILTHNADDRHPDHPAAHRLVRSAAFFAWVDRYPSEGPRWRVDELAYFVGNTFDPDPRADWVVDVSETIQVKYAALEAYGTQFRAEPGDTQETYISSRAYWDHLDRRGRIWGHYIGAAYAEPFLLDRSAHAGHAFVRLLPGASG